MTVNEHDGGSIEHLCYLDDAVLEYESLSHFMYEYLKVLSAIYIRLKPIKSDKIDEIIKEIS
jgi:hypothetical protein